MENDSDLDNQLPQLNPMQVVTTLHTPTFFYQVLYVCVHLNEIGVEAMVDTGTTHNCLVSSVAAKLNMKI